MKIKPSSNTIFNNINKMKEFGFYGFKTISELKENINLIPNEKGIYIIIKETDNIDFRKISTGGHFKGKNPTVPIYKLQTKWIKESSIIYIGKAGGKNSKSNLKKRLNQYIKFGEGQPIGHWGGRYIWQITESDNLIVAWKTLRLLEPRDLEKQLINNFEKYYNALPYANLCR